MRKAFTLIELLAVIGIMGMMGVAAAASYGALVNGMKERSACAAASAILREAGERARIDRLPTVVYCYNVCLKEPVDDEPGIVAGMMTAIRRVGRITGVRDRLLFDEFADLDQSYETSDEENYLRNMRGHRMFKYNDESSVQSRMQYSVVADAVYRDDGAQTALTAGQVCHAQISDRSPSDRAPDHALRARRLEDRRRLRGRVRRAAAAGRIHLRAAAAYEGGRDNRVQGDKVRPGVLLRRDGGYLRVAPE